MTSKSRLIANGLSQTCRLHELLPVCSEHFLTSCDRTDKECMSRVSRVAKARAPRASPPVKSTRETRLLVKKTAVCLVRGYSHNETHNKRIRYGGSLNETRPPENAPGLMCS
ncbi:hypothetical protein EYF80_026623 [Liparis tanakae]|uniref:Uncharacterized protein n=1 Tax=Liparis tanakae TaxID=230148 RepID=A0A4Z2HBG5_9TELE|nr:hypothetical protein EYF80_026623 [Liparis tanakae]